MKGIRQTLVKGRWVRNDQEAEEAIQFLGCGCGCLTLVLLTFATLVFLVRLAWILPSWFF